MQFLFSKDAKDNMPRGVLFRVHNGMGYKIGKIDETTDEVLFELGATFMIDSMKEVSKDKFIVVNLSFVSPISENEKINM